MWKVKLLGSVDWLNGWYFLVLGFQAVVSHWTVFDLCKFFGLFNKFVSFSLLFIFFCFIFINLVSLSLCYLLLRLIPHSSLLVILFLLVLILSSFSLLYTSFVSLSFFLPLSFYPFFSFASLPLLCLVIL